MTQHRRADHDCGDCIICNLSVCAICGLYEGTLTSECPGVECSDEKRLDIYAGLTDYIDGSWIDACSPHSPTYYRR